MNSSTSKAPTLHVQVDSLLEHGATPLNLVKHKEGFRDRALQDVTMNSENPMTLDPNNPTLVREETALQKDYLSKLKFTYLEQDAKRNFLQAVTIEDPKGVPAGENEALEQSNAEKKQALKESKTEIDAMRDEAIRIARDNSLKHVRVSQKLSEVQAAQKKIRDMELELARIKATYPPEDRMTVAQANDILDNQTEEMQRLMEEQGDVTRQTERVRENVAMTAKDVQRLERERDREEARAREVQEGREAGDTKVDDMCRWLNSSIAFYKTLMGIRSVTAASEHSLHLEYDTPNQSPVTLMLDFEMGTRALIGAELSGSDVDIQDAYSIACATNDVPGLIADILVLIRARQ